MGITRRQSYMPMSQFVDSIGCSKQTPQKE